MPKYRVFVPEVHYQTVEVEAPTPAAAVQAVLDGEGDYLDDTLEYSHALDVTEMLVRDCTTGKEERVEAADQED